MQQHPDQRGEDDPAEAELRRVLAREAAKHEGRHLATRLALTCSHSVLQIVHLIRDPRPQVQSQMRKFKRENAIANIATLCKTIEG